MLKTYDVAIVGAGLVGSLAAILLSQKGLQVALIDPSSGQVSLSMPPAYDTRVSAISNASQRLLTRAGVWQNMTAERLSYYHKMDVWDGLGSGDIQFDAMQTGFPALGCLVENAALQDVLFQYLQRSTSVEMHFADSLSSFQVADQLVTLVLDSGKKIQASLLVGADGARSKVRELAAFETREWDYGHHAIVATLEIDRNPQGTAWQAFGEEGVLAFLPMPSFEGRYFVSIVWSVSPDVAQQLCSLSANEFCRRAQYALSNQFTVLALHSERQAIPLRQRHAKQYVQSRIALVGDAAHTIHPLAGQGANIGFSDVDALVEVLSHGFKRKDDIGREVLLRRYQRARLLENWQMTLAMEGFKRLFGTQQPSLVLARNLGMTWLNRRSRFKEHVMRRATGQS